MAFVLGVAVVVGLRAYSPGPADHDPLPDPSEVQSSIRRLSREASPAQRPALADGRVDAVEYRSAVRARIACLRSRGTPALEIIGPVPIARGRLLTWHFRVPGDGIEASEADRSCAAEHSEAIEGIWKLQAVPHGEERAREVQELAACLREQGVALGATDVRSVLTGAAVAEVPVGFCADRHAVLFNL